MIVRRLRVDGFGCLQGEWTFDPGRLNLVVGDNERGKSTLAAALTAALYGLDSDRRSYRDRLTPLEQYRPWAPDRPYALELEFEMAPRRFVVNRHFGHDKLHVYEDGRDMTETFRHGSGEYKVGEELLGMNVDQFARCALWLQPGPGRFAGDDVRPDSSLASLLERLASSVQGDASAAQALTVLDGALRNYRGVQQSGLIVNEIRKLENALALNDTELHAIHEDRKRMAEDVAELADLHETEARLARELEGVRTAAARRRLAELTRALRQDGEERSRLAEYEKERARLAPAATCPPDAAERLQRAEAERDAARRARAQVAETRARDLDEPRRDAEEAMGRHAAFAWATPGQADELRVLERDLTRAREQVAAARARLAALEADLRGRGVELARLRELNERFGQLERDARLSLTQYPAQTQALVVDSETAQRALTGGETTLAAVRSARQALRVWGFVVLGVGLAAGAGAVVLAVRGVAPASFAGLALTLVAMGAGIFLLLRSASHRNAERLDALRQLTEAQRRLGELRAKRREREDTLRTVAERLSFEDVTVLLREYGEFQRLTDDGQRMAWLEEDLTRQSAEAARLESCLESWIERSGLPRDCPAAEALALVQAGVAGALAATGALRALEPIERALAEREATARAQEVEARTAATRVAAELGLDVPAGEDWSAFSAAVEARVRDRARLEALESELLPGVARVLLAPDVRAHWSEEAATLARELGLRIEAAEAGDAREAGAAAAGVAESLPMGDPQALERRLEQTRSRRAELFGQVGVRDRELALRLAERASKREELEQALARARAFRAAVELARSRFELVARETHARWSEYLGSRVGELLPRLGFAHTGFQISDKLEASLSLAGERLAQDHLDQVLSAGARDQLGIAIRVAVCEFLGRNAEPLPIVLDDPLASADDGRAAGILRALADMAALGHQVIVLTCHRAKLAAVRALEPAWFERAVMLQDFEVVANAGSAPEVRSGIDPRAQNPFSG